MKEIVAKEGMWLTQATINNEDERIFASKVLTPDVSLWREATQAEKEQWEAAHPIEEPQVES